MVFNLPNDFSFTVEQVAKILGRHPDTVRAKIALDPSDRYYLKARQDIKGGAYMIFKHDLEDCIARSYVGAKVRVLAA